MRLRENERIRAYNLDLTEKIRKLQGLRAQAARDCRERKKARGTLRTLEDMARRAPSDANPSQPKGGRTAGQQFSPDLAHGKLKRKTIYYPKA
jgi:hypothetical protein